jgi:hypothetical protein
VCLERDPDDRYESTLDFARALDAGLQDEATEATRRLVAGAADGDATSVLGDRTAATRALRLDGPPEMPPRPPGGPPRRGTSAAEPLPARRSRQRATGRALVLLAVLMAAAAIALLLLYPDNAREIAPIDRDDVRQQIDGIEQFLREHAKP